MFKIPVTLLALCVGFCGWLAYHQQSDPNPSNLYAPNSMNRVRIPVPVPISPEAVREEKAIIAASMIHADLKIDGKEILSRRKDMRDTERHDLAHVLYRTDRSCTQTR